MQDWDAIWEECKKFKIQQKKEEYVELLKVLERRGCRTLLEIGTNTGGTARGFLEVVEYVTAVDIAKFIHIKPLEENFTGFKFIHADSTQLELGGLFDCLYIDGEHTEEGCRADFDNFRHHVKKGGVIAFHDIARSELHEQQNCYVWKVWEEAKLLYPEHLEFVFGDLRWGGIGVLLVP